jgi:CASC3/Barentsz eIF4AIII binding
MSRERKRSTKLAQSRRRNQIEYEDVDNNEVGPAIIDDSASDANSEDDIQLSGSDNDDDDEEEDEERDPNSDQKTKGYTKESISLPTSESYDRLGDDTLPGGGVVGSSASNRPSKLKKANDTIIMMNGFKDIPIEEDGSTHEDAMQFDELDDSISFAPRQADTKPSSTATIRAAPSATRRGSARERPDRETYWQRRNREREEYKKRLEDPTFTPYVGEFFMHDSRKKRQFDSLNHSLGPRGKGRGRGFKGAHRDTAGKSDSQQEGLWGHDGFEELEPRQSSRAGSSKVRLSFIFGLILGEGEKSDKLSWTTNSPERQPSGRQFFIIGVK